MAEINMKTEEAAAAAANIKERPEYAISVRDVSKMYKLYSSNKDRVAEALGFSRKQRYREHYALHHINFNVARGETVGIIGTNGAGKSTILKIITGVLNPTEGSVEIDGRISALLELGAGFNAEYTGIENVYLNGTMMGYSREEVAAKMQDILDFADIGDFVYQPVKTYSSGMFVRLAFAVAINIDPEILVVDEALSVGDVFFQMKCYQKFDEFKKAGKTILFVSHDLNSISKYCDRVVLFNKGEKLAEGSPKDMINLYKKILSGSKEDKKKIEEEYKGSSEAAGKGEVMAEVIDTDADPNAPKVQHTAENPYSLKEINPDSTNWKKAFQLNPHLNEYGDHDADVIDFAIRDEDGNLTSSIIKGSTFTLTSKVRFNRDVKNPIFTYTFKNVRGIDITGTNTMYEKAVVPLAKEGETYTCTFKQTMNLQGGEYLLSMSCTSFDQNGNLLAHHRCYDLVSVMVISDQDTVGFFDMFSKVEIEKVEQ